MGGSLIVAQGTVLFVSNTKAGQARVKAANNIEDVRWFLQG
jgi:hypothetical protein